MKFQIGDKVKFMDQMGEGVITRITGPSTLGVTVDGFELPYAASDLIKMEKPSSAAERLFYEGKATYGNPEPKEEDTPAAKPKQAPAPKTWADYGLEDDTPAPPKDTTSTGGISASTDGTPAAEDDTDTRISPLRRSFGGKNPQNEGVYIALVPLDQQFMLRGPLEFYIVNYTPHTLLYSLATRGAENFYGVDFASVPPYSKIWVESIEREDLGLWTEGILQGLFYQDESPLWQLPFSKDYKIRVNHLGRQENYVFPVFMQQKTLLVPVLDAKLHEAEGLAIDAGKARNEEEKTSQPAQNIVTDSKNPLQAYMIQRDVAEVDLHVEKLLATRLEMKNAEEKDYLARQLQVFETCLNQAINHRLSKIIFIHGVGEGTLKHEIEKRLRQYPDVHFMDASITRYGRGAIEVYLKE